MSSPWFPTSIPSTRIQPSDEDTASAARMLAGAQQADHPHGRRHRLFLTRRASWPASRSSLGADVWGADNSEVNIPADHPLYKGGTGHMFGANSSRVTHEADAILIVGTYVFPEVFPFLSGSDIFAPGAKIVHIDLNAYEIGKNFPVDLGIVADPKLSLAKLSAALDAAMSAAQKSAAKARV